MLFLFALVALLTAADVIEDLSEGTSVQHVAIELSIVGVGLAGAGFATRRYIALRRQARALESEARALESDLEATREEAERWRGEAEDLIAGLGAAIERQFDRWDLTPAEAEVAMLMLKGLSHGEIAEVRGVTAATARQQARSVYQKAGVSGRNELSAFFLEDLMLPRSQRG